MVTRSKKAALLSSHQEHSTSVPSTSFSSLSFSSSSSSLSSLSELSRRSSSPSPSSFSSSSPSSSLFWPMPTVYQHNTMTTDDHHPPPTSSTSSSSSSSSSFHASPSSFRTTRDSELDSVSTSCDDDHHLVMSIMTRRSSVTESTVKEKIYDPPHEADRSSSYDAVGMPPSVACHETRRSSFSEKMSCEEKRNGSCLSSTYEEEKKEEKKKCIKTSSSFLLLPSHLLTSCDPREHVYALFPGGREAVAEALHALGKEEEERMQSLLQQEREREEQERRRRYLAEEEESEQEKRRSRMMTASCFLFLFFLWILWLTDVETSTVLPVISFFSSPFHRLSALFFSSSSSSSSLPPAPAVTRGSRRGEKRRKERREEQDQEEEESLGLQRRQDHLQGLLSGEGERRSEQAEDFVRRPTEDSQREGLSSETSCRSVSPSLKEEKDYEDSLLHLRKNSDSDVSNDVSSPSFHHRDTAQVVSSSSFSSSSSSSSFYLDEEGIIPWMPLVYQQGLDEKEKGLLRAKQEKALKETIFLSDSKAGEDERDVDQQRGRQGPLTETRSSHAFSSSSGHDMMMGPSVHTPESQSVHHTSPQHDIPSSSGVHTPDLERLRQLQLSCLFKEQLPEDLVSQIPLSLSFSSISQLPFIRIPRSMILSTRDLLPNTTFQTSCQIPLSTESTSSSQDLHPHFSSSSSSNSTIRLSSSSSPPHRPCTINELSAFLLVQERRLQRQILRDFFSKELTLLTKRFPHKTWTLHERSAYIREHRRTFFPLLPYCITKGHDRNSLYFTEAHWEAGEYLTHMKRRPLENFIHRISSLISQQGNYQPSRPTQSKEQQAKEYAEAEIHGEKEEKKKKEKKRDPIVKMMEKREQEKNVKEALSVLYSKGLSDIGENIAVSPVSYDFNVGLHQYTWNSDMSVVHAAHEESFTWGGTSHRRTATTDTHHHPHHLLYPPHLHRHLYNLHSDKTHLPPHHLPSRPNPLAPPHTTTRSETPGSPDMAVSSFQKEKVKRILVNQGQLNSVHTLHRFGVIDPHNPWGPVFFLRKGKPTSSKERQEKEEEKEKGEKGDETQEGEEDDDDADGDEPKTLKSTFPLPFASTISGGSALKADGIFTEEEAQRFLPEWMLPTDRVIIEKDGRSMCFHPLFRRQKTSSQSPSSFASEEEEERDCPISIEEDEDNEDYKRTQRMKTEENEEEESISLPRLDSVHFEEVLLASPPSGENEKNKNKKKKMIDRERRVVGIVCKKDVFYSRTYGYGGLILHEGGPIGGFDRIPYQCMRELLSRHNAYAHEDSSLSHASSSSSHLKKEKREEERMKDSTQERRDTSPLVSSFSLSLAEKEERIASVLEKACEVQLRHTHRALEILHGELKKQEGRLSLVYSLGKKDEETKKEEEQREEIEDDSEEEEEVFFRGTIYEMEKKRGEKGEEKDEEADIERTLGITTKMIQAAQSDEKLLTQCISYFRKLRSKLHSSSSSSPHLPPSTSS
ncbi:transmembrane protein [Cystoisospora suis]|uniref:Transmembrane protein n=1 Tax=Cystoisospora suis TaxID=483139 RepID=A0A2C6KU64_9APIC|nr:transmembrane protein [Cystoisospora suis]